MSKERFIVIDGNDGSGKATQAALLVERFKKEGRDAVKVNFPAYDTNVFGALIAECLAGKHGDFVGLDPRVASSLYALDRFESSVAIREALDAGKVVIADRFTSSNKIHQGGKIADEAERAAFLEWIDNAEHDVLRIPRPDVVVYLQVPLETSLALLAEKRKVKNAHLGEGEKDQVEADRGYLERSDATAKWLAAREPSWRLIECMEEGQLCSREAIHERVWTALGEGVA